ncbi:hypothetical protein EDB81DRAFT_920569 [Dactylonectria macrodidyma]|uniref:Uncharacterized protein n=1 Tax=Dactylonectria macrodidyma TaxID=307937 RepID=A0A9P9D6N7_9HYPO|nr:hypothetical protein EDB81DRAFT_920569 [Dactylonectria macrodidyma]
MEQPHRPYSTIHTSGPLDTFDIVPLTTVWSAPEDCPSILQFEYVESSSSCYPPDYSAVFYYDRFYSPGICPDGYTSGCKPTDTDYGPIRSTETAAICVPSSYSCSSGFQAHAISASGDNTDHVPAFQIRWAESDLSVLETPPVTTADPPSEASRSTATVIGTASTESKSSPSSPSLSTSTVAGIAVASAAIVAIIAAFLFFLFQRRVLHASQKDQGPAPQQQPYVWMPELETPAQPVSAVAAPKQPYVSGTIPELEPREKSPPAGNIGGGVAYMPANARGSGMAPELPFDSRIPEYGTHVTQDMGARHELVVQERSVVEMDGSSPQGGVTRNELS